MPQKLKLTPRESVTVRRADPDALEVEATYAPGGKAPPSHLHPEQEEHFEVLEGSVQTRVEEVERTLAQGEQIDIPSGTPHQIWNQGEEPARVRWVTRPAGRTRQWFEAVDALHRSGRVGSNGMPGPLASAALLHEYDDTFQLAAGPRPLVRGALALLAPLGRARGYLRPPG